MMLFSKASITILVAKMAVLVYFLTVEYALQSSANIIRLAHKRSAYFELSRTDRIHALGHAKQVEVISLQECFAECTATDGCKSINFQYYDDENNEELTRHQCQLVEYDSNVNPVYNVSIGWHHYDTGMSRRTRFTHKTQPLKVCVRPMTNNVQGVIHYGCTLPGATSRYVVAHDIQECTGMDAWYDYNAVTGILRHLCTSRYILPRLVKLGENIWHHSNVIMSGAQSRFRRNFRGFVTFGRFCLRPRGSSTSTSPDNPVEITDCHGQTNDAATNDDLLRFQFSDLERGPVKVSVYDGLYTSIDDDPRWIANNPDWFGYQDDMNIIVHYLEYGSYKIQALFVPPFTGEYQFYLTCDDECSLFLGSTEDESSKTHLIYSNRQSNLHLFQFSTSAQSSPQYLEKGKRYYIEGNLAEQTGDEFFTVGVRYPDENTVRPLERDLLQPLT